MYANNPLHNTASNFKRFCPHSISFLKKDNSSAPHTYIHTYRVLSVSVGLFALTIPKFNQYQESKLGARSWEKYYHLW